MPTLFDIPDAGPAALVQILPVGFDATTSYRPGTSRGPDAILAASAQVDLCDPDVGEPHLAGIHMEPISTAVMARNAQARSLVEQIVKNPNLSLHSMVNQATATNNQMVYDWTKTVLANGKLPVILGGDHSVPFGAIRACAEAHPGMGILHFDAHADLREAYQGFEDSHASIMFNVIQKIPQVSRLTQVGIRDFCQEELALIKGSNSRIMTYFDKHLRAYRDSEKFQRLAKSIVNTLPQQVYVSFDIDGLDPVFCPNTGTPVPGGLSLDNATILLQELATSGRQIIGFDLVEVAPPRETSMAQLGESWDANVGARLLYKLIGFALMSRGESCARAPELPDLTRADL